jgi:hypothetical protein
MSTEKEILEQLFPKNRTQPSQQELLEKLLLDCGYDPEEVASIAQQSLHHAATMQVGTGLGGIHTENLPSIWEAAKASGARRILLEIKYQEDGYHLEAKVLEREDFHPLPEGIISKPHHLENQKIIEAWDYVQKRGARRIALEIVQAGSIVQLDIKEASK